MMSAKDSPDLWFVRDEPGILASWLDKRMIEDYTLGTTIIDACKPYRWREHWDKMFKLSDIDEELRKRTAEKWEGVLGSFITAPKPL